MRLMLIISMLFHTRTPDALIVFITLFFAFDYFAIAAAIDISPLPLFDRCIIFISHAAR